MTLKVVTVCLLAIIASSSCRTRQVTSAAIAVTPTPSMAPQEQKVTTANSNSSTEEKVVVDGIKIIDNEIAENNEKQLCEINLTYPQIQSPRTWQQRQFNQLIKNRIRSELKGFKSFCSQNRKLPNGKVRTMPYSLGMSYNVAHANKKIISLEIRVESFTGYVNSDWGTIMVNYDLTTGKTIKLADLFASKAGYLKRISEESIAQLKKRTLSCGGGWDGTQMPEFQEGTRPKYENYSEWTLSQKGLGITFGEYQIGPGCLGLVSIHIPYESLQDIINPEIVKKINYREAT